ncbi:mechanosensitive ion channel family protein [Jejuia pallidilutea]|jgi:miniconductance mechanosensitive channel|uniref:Mechanosensing system component YbdG n=2 Tax=Jejuia pallidilutea TaxID=504487 RepID=A0A090VT09_9FLAO|nr:mechanosensitive ion channel domain-containing protein [Jejuia pallidilutea]PQV47754.1 miniconductance mechanosensitive channel [Jejuia pallidilutea]GAL67128.1 small-conductance mechanosensitive channel [Jejuia pallidilutea]GAL90688.1 small-conductance mechanosensitive channel [Jejuia pallidilutea]
MIQTENINNTTTEKAVTLKHWVFNKLTDYGLSEQAAEYLNMLILLIGLLLIIFIVDIVIRKILIGAFSQFAKRSKTNFDDLLISNKVPRNIAHIIPLLIALEFVPDVFADFYNFEIIIEKGLKVFAIILTLWIVRSVLHTIKDFLKTLPRLKDKPIDSYIQVFMIFAWLAGIMSAIAIITDIPFLKFLTGMGAISAVIILVFKDTILGFVASIQVSINDMVRIGDWITFEKYGADGDVIEINLATVKVQNFDKTITTIPTYALISDSFKNWRGMTNSGGRRIKRAVNIKQDSIKCLTASDIEKLKHIQLIKPYLEDKQKDVEAYNKNNNINKELLLNGRNLTNIGVFRKYIQTYIENHSAINKDMTIMVRQLAPTAQGLPIEIYAFSSDKRWVNYEYIMADIFDHVLAAVPYFGLEIFELPSSLNLKN